MNFITHAVRTVRSYLRNLDERSRHRMARDEDRRSDVAAERQDRDAERRGEAAFFRRGLPPWVVDPGPFAQPAAAETAIEAVVGRDPESDRTERPWVASVDLAICQRAIGRRRFARLTRRDGPVDWMIARPAGRHERQVLQRGTRLRLAGRAERAVGGADPVLPFEDPPHAAAGLRFEVLDGPFRGRLVATAALSRSAPGNALVAAAMVAPAGHRIADWPSAADEVLSRHLARLAGAERAARQLAYEERWAWRHDLVKLGSRRRIVEPLVVTREPSDED